MENQKTLQQLIQNIDSDIGLEKLRSHGKVYGFQNIYFRRTIWKKLLGIDKQMEYQERQKCVQHDQLLKDVNRSLNTISQMKNFKEIEKLRKCLMDVLDTIFSDNPNYSYYQGYHDIISIFILVLGVEDGFVAGAFAAKNFFKDYLNQELASTITPQIQFIRHLLLRYARDTSDHKLNQLMNIIEHPTCVIPWILTWFSHSLEDINDICRVWDYLFCSKQNSILYVCAAFIAVHEGPLNIRNEDDLMGDFQEYFQNLNNKERISDLKLEIILKLASQLERQYKFEKICEEHNLLFAQGSIVYSSNFQEQLPYYYQLQKLQNSKRYRFKNFISGNSELLLQFGGIAISFVLQMYLIKK